MSEWVTSCIGDACDILDNQRIPLNGEQRSKIPGSIPYYGANGVQGYINDYIFDEDLILIAEDGGNFEQYDERPIAYKISGKSWVNNHAHILRAKNGYDQDYVFYSVVHKNIIAFIKGGTRSKLNQAELREITFPHPNHNQQKKISFILTTADNLIEKTEALIKKYQAIKQGMMHDLFTRGIDAHGKLRTTYEIAPHLYKESELGWIPKEWEVKTIEEISLKVTDGDHHTPIRSERGIYLLSARNVLNGSLTLDNVDYVEEAEYKRMIRRCHPEPGDILISCSGTVGRVCAVPEGLKCVLVRSAALVKPNYDFVSSRFLEWALRTADTTSQIRCSLLQAAQPNLFQGAIKKLKIPLPSNVEQISISSKLDELARLAYLEITYAEKLKTLKAGLMQDLLTGKVRVPLSEQERKAA